MIGSKFWCWGGGFRAQLGNGRRRRGGGGYPIHLGSKKRREIKSKYS